MNIMKKINNLEKQIKELKEEQIKIDLQLETVAEIETVANTKFILKTFKRHEEGTPIKYKVYHSHLLDETFIEDMNFNASCRPLVTKNIAIKKMENLVKVFNIGYYTT